jgi:hypothetical protein
VHDTPGLHKQLQGSCRLQCLVAADAVFQLLLICWDVLGFRSSAAAGGIDREI